MIIIGSHANDAILASSTNRGEDYDFLVHVSEVPIVLKGIIELLNAQNVTLHKCTDDQVCIQTEYGIWEFFIGHSNNSTEQLLNYCNNKRDGFVDNAVKAPLNVQYCLKMSHRYLRNSPHFLKTMSDIKILRSQGAVLDDELQRILELREKETYDYKHPDLSVSKGSFFNGDDVPYKYDHDTIHEAIAIGNEPAYKSYMKDGAEVMTSREKFEACSEYTKLLGVYEEACVLALERSQIPFALEGTPELGLPPTPKHSFITALIKVCSSITSGWFREYAWENFYKVIKMYRHLGEDDYIKRFNKNRAVLKPYK